MVFIVLYKLSDRYYEIVKNVGTVEDDRKEDDTVNDTVNLSQLTERQRKIYEAIKNGMENDTINVQLSNINKLTERQIVIYNSIKESVQLNVQLNTTDLSNKLRIGFKTMQRELKVIENLGLIVRVGSKKTGHWDISPVMLTTNQDGKSDSQ